MSSSFASKLEFIRGAAVRSDLVCVITKVKEFAQKGVPHFMCMANHQGEWSQLANGEWDATAIAFAEKPSKKVILIGQEGDVIAYAEGAPENEKLDPQPSAIRNACEIEGYVYACGMKRQVYKRTGESKWKDIGAPSPKAKQETGFEAIHGFTAKEIYAVGWSGEIWQYDGKIWTERKSPTKKILTCVHCAPDGTVYAGGQEGILIQGRNENWEVLKIKGLKDDIWDVHWFNDQLYVATISGLYTLQGQKLIPVDLGPVEASSFYNLISKDGVLWSTGQTDLISFDGKKWRRYS
jgi:hypothetical protein